MSLFGSLITSAGALRVFEKALETTQNNVSNASTPGFAKQRLVIESLPFDADRGLPGGLISGGLDSFRNQYAEEAVRRRQEEYGLSDQLASELSRIEAYFDVTEGTGIAGALNRFFQGISSWSVAPNGTTSRALVIEQAAYLAAMVRDTANGLVGARTATDQQIRNTVDSVNHLAGIVRDLNSEVRRDYQLTSDPGFDARLQTVLEELAQYANFTALKQADGTLTILLGGQTPLVVGDRHYEIIAGTEGGALLDSQGRDISAQVTRGRLGALLQHRLVTLPSFLSSLDRLAAALADRVNAVLASGVDLNNQPGAPLFSYDAVAGAALTLRVTSITAEQLAGALPGSPGGNGNVLNFVGLADSAEIDGSSLMAYYGGLARSMGLALEGARDSRTTNRLLLLQAQTVRQEISGVSLDEEAIRLVEFQRAYQASARMVTVLSELTEIAISLLR